MTYFISIALLCFAASIQALALEKVDGIVAVINTEVITETALSSFAKKIETGGMIDDLLLLGKSSSDLKNNKPEQLEYLINEKLLESEIKRLNLAITTERVEQELRDIAKKNGISRADLSQAIKAQGMVFSEYQAFIKSRIEKQSLIEQEISSKIRVSDEDVLAEYSRSNASGDSGVYEYALAHIYFNPKKGGAKAAEERARNVLTKIKAGLAFDSAAEQHSEDAGFSTGGTLGTFKQSEMSKEMEGGLKGLSAGQVSDVIKLKDGFHILKVVSKTVVSDPRFEKEKEKLRGRLFEVAFQKQFKNWLLQKREESFVRINQ